MPLDPEQLRTVRQNAGRFMLQSSGERWRVIEWSDRPLPTQTPRCAWTDRPTADALRDRLCRGVE